MGSRKRGFLEEFVYQQQLAEQRRRKSQQVAEKDAERRRKQAAQDEQKALAKRQTAEAEARTRDALEALRQIDSILVARLQDPPLDIDSITHTAEHPPFDAGGLNVPIPPPRLDTPPEPQLVLPKEPTGVLKIIGKQQHREAVDRAKAVWAADHQSWTHHVTTVLPKEHAKLMEQHAAQERNRQQLLYQREAKYREECAARERNAAQENRNLEAVRSALDSKDPKATAEFICGFVNNTWYPEEFKVSHEFQFDGELCELTVTTFVPPPSSMPTIKGFKPKAGGGFSEISCTQKEQRDRYNGAVAAVAIRTFYEIFDADQRQCFKTISLTVETDAINPATGIRERYRFIAAAADRSDFSNFILDKIDPIKTLAHMRSAMSKNPHDLQRISTARGIR